MKTSLTAYGWGLAVVLSWGGCDLAQPMALPRCQDGLGLGTDSQGNFRCVQVRPAQLTVPPVGDGCSATQTLQHPVPSTALRCLESTTMLTERLDGPAMVRKIDELEVTMASLAKSVELLDTTAAVKAQLYVGNTTAVTTGRITNAGTVGLLAANALCATQFGSRAHMCTPFQLTRSVAKGKLGPKDRIAPAWIYMPAWHNPNASTSEPLAGLADNCGGYTTGDDTAGWAGMAVEWSPLASGDVVFRWHGGADAPCSARLPIACCSGDR